MNSPRVWNGAGFPPIALLPDIACGGSDPELFFPEYDRKRGITDSDRAIRVCRLCPHETACLAWAIETRQDYGVWGGTTPHGRRKILERSAA